MRDLFSRRLPTVLFGIFFILTSQILISWVFVRFLHYEGQYRHLLPETYQAKIITQEDYALLQDQTKESVTLSDGSTLTDRQPSFYQNTIPSYKQVGDHYLLVTTLGTSHYYYRWISDMFPLMIFSFFGLIAARIHARQHEQSLDEVGKSEADK